MFSNKSCRTEAPCPGLSCRVSATGGFPQGKVKEAAHPLLQPAAEHSCAQQRKPLKASRKEMCSCQYNRAGFDVKKQKTNHQTHFKTSTSPTVCSMYQDKQHLRPGYCLHQRAHLQLDRHDASAQVAGNFTQGCLTWVVTINCFSSWPPATPFLCLRIRTTPCLPFHPTTCPPHLCHPSHTGCMAKEPVYCLPCSALPTSKDAAATSLSQAL